jgi:aldose 1-epimerase
VLIPWPNRLQDGSYEFDGLRHQLSLNEPERRNTIHGLVRWLAWTATQRDPHRVVMEHVLPPQPGYPSTMLDHAFSDLEVTTFPTSGGAALPSSP